MCGILGIYNINSSDNFNINTLKVALSKMHHRGPDASGIKVFDNKAVLSHVRLSIIDLNAESNQPFEWSGRYVISFNGEIYNYLELKKELVSVGYSFHTKSDTEVLIASYQEWGQDCVNRFNGMWAFAIYDREEDVLFCSRDRFGVKPFNYAVVNGQFIFSSEIKSIISYFPELKKPNYNVIANFCRHGTGAQIRETWFENVFRLEPAHNIVITKEAWQIKRYWDYPRQVDQTISFEEAVIKYRDLFIDSVNLRMRSDVPVGFTLSSGLDSSSIVSVLKDKLTGNDRTYTASFSNYCFDKSEKQNYKEDVLIDEPAVVRKLSNVLQLKPTIVEVDFRNYAEELSNIIYHLESGHNSPAVFPLNYIEKVAAEDITVILEGQGADELLAGYLNNVNSFYLIELLSKFKIKKAYNEFNNFRKIYSIQSLIMLYFRQLNIEWLQKIYYKVSGKELFFKGKLKKYRHIKDYPNEKMNFDNPVNTNLYKSHTGGLINLLHYGDAISMTHSLESRLPFMDYRLVELAFTLPSEYKISNGLGKFVHRKAMEGLVPDFILSERIKFGFSTPISNLFKVQEANPISDILLSEECRKREIFCDKTIRRALNELQNGKKDWSQVLYRMLNVELWFRKFIDTDEMNRNFQRESDETIS